jgi:hypothetical protein
VTNEAFVISTVSVIVAPHDYCGSMKLHGDAKPVK